MAADRLAILAAWADTRFAAWRLTDRAAVARRQARLWRALAPTLRRTPALSALAGRPFGDFPGVTPATLRENFAAWNTLGLSEFDAFTAASNAEQGRSDHVIPGVSAGFSTGGGATRGLFVATRSERARYLGQALAKLLPDLKRPWRIALCLRADSALYRDVSAAGRIKFRFIGLDEDPQHRAAILSAFAPDILIAPSHVLADLARRTQAGEFSPPALTCLFYGAEPMGEIERAWIGAVLGIRPDPIYQATEGFLGAACTHGTLHLNEDALIIERAPVLGTNRFTPIVTDLFRTTQPMVRVRLDDLLEPLDGPCPCGSPLAAVRGVEGRLSDLWRWGEAVITPREVDEALSGAIGAETAWRATAGSADVRLETAPDQAAAGAAALADLLDRHGVSPSIAVMKLGPQGGPKRRRVRWRHG
jgi:putative adenylate-forming enzyme